MNGRFGRCLNQDYCTLALHNTVLRLGEGELFVCPECARPLAPAPAWAKGGAGRAAVARLLPPMAITAIGAVAIVLGLQHPDQPKPVAKPHPVVTRQVVASARPAAKAPAAKVVPRVAPPQASPEIVLLNAAASPPLNTMLLPQLAAAFLATGRSAAPNIATQGDAVHISVPSDGRLLSILVREAAGADSKIAAAADIVCTDGTVAQDAAKPARVDLGAMPVPPNAPVTCYLGPTGPATDFGLFLATPDAQRIVAASGYARPAPVAPKQPASPQQQTAVPVDKPAKAASPAAPAAQQTDDTAAAAPGPRTIHMPDDAKASFEALKAMTAPDQLAAGAPAGGDAAPHPRRVYLPASSMIKFEPYQAVKMAEQPAHLFFVNPSATRTPGNVKVDCKIGIDGIPADCRELSHTGTSEAAAAILAWLPSGGVRYAPGMKDGRKVAERRVLTVNFGGAAGH